jgi:hypothetical protein
MDNSALQERVDLVGATPAPSFLEGAVWQQCGEGL